MSRERECIMKKLTLFLTVLGMSALLLTGCNKEEAGAEPEMVVEAIVEGVNDAETAKAAMATPTPEPVEEVEEEEVAPEGCYRSELTNEWISEDIKNQRPIACMIDNEKKALPHYGVNTADVVYEIMNSTANDRITRLMAIVKDWKNIERLGSVRSTRPTNFFLAGEWNAILIHDGGPFYNDEYYARDYTNNLSGGFARVINGKATEFTEYVTYDSYTNTQGKTYDGLGARIEASKYSPEYNEFYPGAHFTFNNKDTDINELSGAIKAENVELPFYHNGSKLKYNPDTKTYDYYEYGEEHIDALDDKITSFKNVILQGCSHTQLDENGYLIYNVIGSGTDGYYLTNGYAVPIAWVKQGETAVTEFKLLTGENITLNTGKTYIGIVPLDTWGEVVVN